MPHRLLGRTRLPASVLGFGCAPGVKDPALYRRAVELGVNYFHVGDRTPAADADVLRILGPFRDRIFIGLMTLPGAAAIPALDQLLHATGVGHIDIWYLITPQPEHLKGAPADALQAARQAGKVRFTGITTHRLATDVGLLTAPGSPIDVVMLSYNFLASPEVVAAVGKLRAAGLGITPMKSMAGGGRAAVAGVPAAAIRWLAADPRVHCAPVAVETIQQLEQDARALSRPLSDADRELLRTERAYASPRFCRMCGACDGQCPQGLPVSDLVRCAMYAEGYGDLRRARQELKTLPPVTCGDCPRCVVQCPNKVAIPDRLLYAQRLLV
jgi:aryl-alcohol dehydrogenase-like predicted oxidoreductase